jgi:hypothetical protein
LETKKAPGPYWAWRFFSIEQNQSNLKGVAILSPAWMALRESVTITVAVVFSV